MSSRNTAKEGDTFEIHHQKDGATNLLTFVPSVPNEGFPPQTIEVTDAQWDALQYHFANGVNDKTKESKLMFIY